MAAAMRRQFPRRAREYTDADELDGETTVATEGTALLRRLRAGSVHFGCSAFRGAFADRCLDSGTLAAVLGRRYEARDGQPVLLGDGISLLRAGRVARQSGVACAGGQRYGTINIVDLPALDAAATISAEHNCNALALIFRAHALEDKGVERVVAEEAELLARTSYGLAYLSPGVCRDLARAYGSEWPGPGEGKCMLADAAAYPRAGEEEGLLVENIWVLRERAAVDYGAEAGPFLPPDGAWPLALAYGLVPAVASGPPVDERDPAGLKAARLRYKRQVACAVQACALAGCDGLIVGCAEGVLGCEVAPHPAAAEAAEVWAEVLLGERGRGGLASQFRTIAFCLGGRTNPRRLNATREALRAAFAM